MDRTVYHLNNQTSVDPWAVLDTMPDGIAILDSSGIIRYINKAWQQQVESSGIQFRCRVGSSYLDSYSIIFALGQLDTEQIAARLHEVQAGLRSSYEFTYSDRLDGQQHWFMVTLHPYVSAYTNGSSSVLVQQRDTTSQQQAISAMQQICNQLEQRIQGRSIQHRRLLEVLQTIMAKLTFEAITHKIYQILHEVLTYDTFTLYLQDQRHHTLRTAFHTNMTGIPARASENLELPEHDVIHTILHSPHGEMINHAQHDPRFATLWDNPGDTIHLLGVPLRAQATTLGIVLLLRRANPPFTIDEFELVQLLLSYATLAIENAQLLVNEQQRARELDLLLRAGLALARELDLPTMARIVVETTAKVFGYCHVGLHLMQGRELVLQHHIGYDPVIERLSLQQGVIGRTAHSGKSILVKDVHNNPDFIGSLHTTSEICVPLFDGDQVVGVLNVETRNEDILNENDLRLLNLFGTHVSISIERARLHTQLRRREEQYRSIVVSVKEVIFQTDLEGRWLFLNPSWIEITGFLLSDTLGAHFLEFIHPDDQQQAAHEFNRLIQGQQISCSYEVRYLSRINGFCWIAVQTWPIFDIDGNITGTSGILNDITERKEAEEILRNRERRFQSLIENITDIILVLDEQGIIHYSSPSVERLLLYATDQILASSFYDLIHEDDLARAQWMINVALQNPATIQNMGEYQVRCSDDAWCMCEIVATNLLDNPTVEGIVVNCHDITERKAAEERLQRLALYDTLTGLPNRAFLMERLQQAIDTLQQNPDKDFAMLFLDLDNFKVVNDSLGHLVGDQFLREITTRLSTCLRTQDMVARLGGDEFTILLKDVKTVNTATEVAERIQSALAEPFYLSGHELFATASIGIAIGARGYTQAQDLLRDADTAMYHAKEQGKARYALFDADMHTRAMERLLMQSDLQRSIDSHELRIYYQPLFALQSGQITGFEALLRWQHPRRGLLSPADFVAVAEETGSIIPIGRWVLHEACRQVRYWQTHFPQAAEMSISVNLSSKQFKHLDLDHDINQVLQETGIAPNRLNLEMSEKVIMEQTNETITTLTNLQAKGIRLCIDDFGTGHASLRHLHSFPIHSLKIDGSFVSRIGANQSTDIMRTIISLARTLGIDVIAEGVETPEQARQIKELGCDYAQGYYFSDPLNQGDIEQLLHHSVRI